jgi:hypothetical protein
MVKRTNSIKWGGGKVECLRMIEESETTAYNLGLKQLEIPPVPKTLFFVHVLHLTCSKYVIFSYWTIGEMCSRQGNLFKINLKIFLNSLHTYLFLSSSYRLPRVRCTQLALGPPDRAQKAIVKLNNNSV